MEPSSAHGWRTPTPAHSAIRPRVECPLMGWTGCSRRSVGCGRSSEPEQPHGQTSQTFPADLAVIGIDIGKDLFHLVGFGRDGTIVVRRKMAPSLSVFIEGQVALVSGNSHAGIASSGSRSGAHVLAIR